MLRGIGTVIALVLFTAVCTGCEGPRPPSEVPSFSQSVVAAPSVAGLGARAKRTFQRYLAVSDRISAEGGEGLVRLEPYVTEREMKKERLSSSYLKSKTLRIKGASKLVKFTLQSKGRATAQVAAYVCIDFSDTYVLNNRGQDVTPASRADRLTSVARFVVKDRGLLLDEISAWPGDQFC